MNNSEENENYNPNNPFSQNHMQPENDWDAPLDNSFPNEERKVNQDRDEFDAVDAEDAPDKDNDIEEEEDDDDFEEEEEEDDFEEEEDEEDEEQEDEDKNSDNNLEEEDEDDLNDTDGNFTNTDPFNPTRF